MVLFFFRKKKRKIEEILKNGRNFNVFDSVWAIRNIKMCEFRVKIYVKAPKNRNFRKN